MKKGFTLVELLGVIVILGLLSAVIIPKVGDSLQNSKETALLTQKDQIKKATKDFLIEHAELLEENDAITIKLGTLKQEGYLPIDLKNPKTRKNISNESTITITKLNNNYEIEVGLIDLENATENIDSNSPILVLNGNYIQYVEINTQYVELGATAMSSSGEEIDDEDISIQVLYNNNETTLTTNQLRTYSVVYTVTDNEGRSTSATRTVIIRDSIAPTITVPKDTSLHVTEVADFNPLAGVTAQDNNNNSISVTVTNSNLANIPGNYVITYTATDSSGNQTTERRIITVDKVFEKHYTYLEYIESTGTQYIMTDIVPSNDMGIYAKLKSENVTSDLIYFGSKGSTDNRFWIGNSSSKIYYGWNTVTAANSRPTVAQDELFEIKMNYQNDRKNIYNNTEIENSLGTLASNTFPIAIFGGNKQGSITAKSQIKLYDLKITKGNLIKYDLRPCMRKSDNVAGLCEIINNKFYKNGNTDEFIKGGPIN